MIEMMINPGKAPFVPAPPGQVFFKNPNPTAVPWVVPEGVDSICAICVGRGQEGTPTLGGEGGDLRWRNNIPVKPGETLLIYNFGIRVPAAGVNIASKIVRQSTQEILLCAKHGGPSSDASTVRDVPNGIGGGNGGGSTGGYGGGGAGGYLGNGGFANGQNGVAGTGGAGGGGGIYVLNGVSYGQGGGGVGVHGQGANGAGGVYKQSGSPGIGGGVGSQLQVGTADSADNSQATTGGSFGGGSGRTTGTSSNSSPGAGIVRILWGEGRSFPSTNVLDK